jgi:hypothetical protein
MYVGFCVGKAEEGRGSGRGAQLSAALSDSSLSSMLYTRRGFHFSQHFEVSSLCWPALCFQVGYLVLSPLLFTGHFSA